MNFFKKIIQVILFLILTKFINSNKYYRKDYSDPGYESLLKWGLDNSLYINNKTKLTIYNGEKNYIANADISKGETILDIPPEITLTINNSLFLKNSENIKNKYNDYILEYQKSNQTLDDISYIDQSFIAYLLYISNKTRSNEMKIIYEQYKYLYYIFEDDLTHLPSFFNDEQINIFLNYTSFGSVFELMNIYLMGEVNILEKKIFKETINLEEYFRYRFLLVQKSYNLSNTTTVVPFIDFIKRDFSLNNINCKLMVNKRHIKIKAIRTIKKGELLSMKPKKITNQFSFIFYGKTYEELIDQMNSFIIPAITPNLLNDEGFNIDIDENEEGNKIDLVWPNFLQILLPIYKEVAQALKRDDSNYSCYEMILKYLTQIKNNYDFTNFDDIDHAFIDEKDAENVKRIIRGEKIFLDKKINYLIDIMNNVKKVKILNNKKDLKNHGEYKKEKEKETYEFYKDL